VDTLSDLSEVSDLGEVLDVTVSFAEADVTVSFAEADVTVSFAVGVCGEDSFVFCERYTS